MRRLRYKYTPPKHRTARTSKKKKKGRYKSVFFFFVRTKESVEQGKKNSTHNERIDKLTPMRKCNHIGPFTLLRTIGITEMENKQIKVMNLSGSMFKYIRTKARYIIRQQRYMLKIKCIRI
jgi:hypothetical protein